MMKKLFIIVIFLLLASVSVLAQDFVISHQAKGSVEYYQSERYDDIWVELKMEHSYIRQDMIFLFPCDYYGNSEYYDLGFFVDMDLNIKNDFDANNYRILYQNDRVVTIPEPISILIFSCLGGILFFEQKKGKS